MAKGSYNSVGAGETPKCYHGKAPSFMMNDVQDGGNQGFGNVKVTTDLPKVASPSGYGTDMGSAPGEAPKAARPGGAQGIQCQRTPTGCALLNRIRVSPAR